MMNHNSNFSLRFAFYFLSLIGFIACAGDSDALLSDESPKQAVTAEYCIALYDLCYEQAIDEAQLQQCSEAMTKMLSEQCEHGIESTDQMEKCIDLAYTCDALPTCFDVVDCNSAPPLI